MTSSYHYKVLMGSWGITVKITCKIIFLTKKNSELSKVSDLIYLDIDKQVNKRKKLNVDEISALVKGISLMKMNLLDSVGKQPIIIRVVDLIFNEIDYQYEGLTAAIIGWISQELGIEFQEPKVDFDKETHRYIFKFNIE